MPAQELQPHAQPPQAQPSYEQFSYAVPIGPPGAGGFARQPMYLVPMGGAEPAAPAPAPADHACAGFWLPFGCSLVSPCYCVSLSQARSRKARRAVLLGQAVFFAWFGVACLALFLPLAPDLMDIFLGLGLPSLAVAAGLAAFYKTTQRFCPSCSAIAPIKGFFCPNCSTQLPEREEGCLVSLMP